MTVAATLGLTTMAGAQALPSSWLRADIGGAAAGSASQSAGTFSLSSRGWDINGGSDQFTFAYVSVRGDVTLVAKLTSLDNVDPWSLAGVMIRESLNANSNHVSMLGTAGNGLVTRARTSNRAGTSEVRAGSYAVPVWLRVERKGSVLASYRSTDGVTWSPVANVKVKFSQSVLVGMAVASHSTSTSASAAFSGVTINGVAVPAPAPPANVPPTVSLSAPGNGATFAAPASISLAATAADSDGMVAKVEFFNGTALLGSDASSPYTFNWSNVAAGTYTVKAVATDNAGATTTSALVNVTVSANTPPAVSLTSPSAGTSFMAPASTTVSATATDANGIARVDFFVGSTLLGSDTSSPYSVSWSNVAAGSYVLTAKAYDTAGASALSAGVTVTVNANQAPTVSLTSPTTGSNFNAPAAITLTASASDVDGTVQKVDFYDGSTLLGTSMTSPFAFTWSNVSAGSYSLSAVARDNMGATAVSSWSDITVGASSTLSKAIFTPAVVPDSVDYYMFEVYAPGATPGTSAPIAQQNLGVPPVVNGECTVDVRSTIAGLAPGSYFATVSSTSSTEGVLRSGPFTFTR